MKIGILTFHFSDNFGALMQAYSLRQWFLQNGHDAFFIPYHPVHVEEGGPFRGILSPVNFKRNLTILYMRILNLWSKYFGDRKQRANFERFRLVHLGLSGSRCLTGDEVQQFISNCAMLVCGSDQIWAPSVQYGVDPVYFLNFPGAENCRRISYAASFGRSFLQPAYSEQVGSFLTGLDAISVRESSGVEIVNQVSGREALIVPDPTVLLGGFSGLIGEPSEVSNHLFCYALRSDKIIRNVAVTVSSILNLSLISARNSRQRWRDIGEGVSLGPEGWLEKLVTARFIVTNSFHGVALAVIYNKPFIAVSLPLGKESLNSRAINLLTSVGLMNRFLVKPDQGSIAALIQQEIDWAQVNDSLRKQRECAETYLFEQIEKTFGVEH
ncbi:polysaccharide pyruvyl transferase family protein [Limnobacter sp.]|uniref:polysaccharide pyruvyl transferase family protein n=1 Tax=Limnobacter sp. TaxID=2003368 RepID=UPI0025C5F18D|nr:polysaccharide pyruvyl transferase family protein [Limnobacter sp.]